MIENMVEEQRNAVIPAETFTQKAISYRECFIVHIINNVIRLK